MITLEMEFEKLMDNTWILVANASTATLYSFTPTESGKGKPQLTVVAELSHPQSREKDQELTSDRPGEYISGTGGHGNFAEASDPHQYEAVIFARELFHKLEQGRVSHQYRDLILVASPHFLGLLRQSIDERPLKNVAIQEVHKDYTKEKPQDLIKLLGLK